MPLQDQVAARSATITAGLQAALQQLADAELIYSRGHPPDASYLFDHALVQEVAYESLLKSAARAPRGRGTHP